MNPRPWLFFGSLLATAAAAPAQEMAPTTATSPAASLSPFTEEQLDQLLGPIALYPDALIALMLPASTSPSEVVLAARFLRAGHDPSGADIEPWDDSVRALARYPETIRWMDENLAWTKQLGETFLAQPDDVMSAIQRLRSRALAAGTLFSTAQQQVVTEGGMIRILPAQPEVIYIPYYNPQVVYLARPRYSSFDEPFLTFGVGFSTGWWLSYGLDWPARRIWVIDRHERERHWHQHRTNWRPGPPPASGRPGYAARPPWQAWHPSPHHPRPPSPSNPSYRPRSEVVRTTPYTGGSRHTNPPRAPDTHRPSPPPNSTPPTSPPRRGPSAPSSDTSSTAPARRPRLNPDMGPMPVVAPPPAATLAPTPSPALSLAPRPAPAPAPAAQPGRTGEVRNEQPGRHRPPREDRPSNPNRSSEPRTRSSPPPAPAAPAPAPAAAPAATRSAPPPPSAAPAATTTNPPADSEERRGRRPNERQH